MWRVAGFWLWVVVAVAGGGLAGYLLATWVLR
jgi:hypothetical protein